MPRKDDTYRSCPRIRVNGKKKRVSHIIMEKIIDRHIEPYEVVHHIDGNPQNNVPSNLEVMLRSDHTKLHNPKDFTRFGISAADNKNLWSRYYRGEKANEMGIKPRVFKITKEIYFTILSFLSEGFSQCEVAKIFNVNQSTICRIKNGKRFTCFKEEVAI